MLARPGRSTHGQERVLVRYTNEKNCAMKVGDIVEIQPHIDFDITKTIFAEPSVGMIKSSLNGDGYYDVLLHNGRVLFLSARNLKVINENR